VWEYKPKFYGSKLWHVGLCTSDCMIDVIRDDNHIISIAMITIVLSISHS